MNFFCSSAEFDEYVTEMELDTNDVIKADIDRALIEAKATLKYKNYIPRRKKDMKVAYLFESEHAREILENMIIPQLEEDRHGVEVAGMMFFFDNAYMLVEGSDIAARLQALSEKTGMLLMACDRCCYQRDIADKLIAPAGIGCFPNVYAALAPAGVDQVITL